MESNQKKLSRVRSPRVHITYDVEIGDAIVQRELPLIVGVLADLSGAPTEPLPPVKEREFVQIDRDNFDDIMKGCQVRLVYVDLNPLRAKISQTPECSVFTSVKQRVESARQEEQPEGLYPFVGNPREKMPDGLPFKLTDYLELLDMTGRIIREDKRGAIDASLLPILQRLNISSENWLCIATEFGSRTGNVVGNEHSISHYCESNHRQRKPPLQSVKLLA